MSLEKGISRIGTVSGCFLGIFFSICSISVSLEQNFFSYFADNYKYANQKDIIELKKHLPVGWTIENEDFVPDDEDGLKIYVPDVEDNVGIDLASYAKEQNGKNPENITKEKKEQNVEAKEEDLSNKIKGKFSKLIYVYLPTCLLVLLVVFLPFFVVFYILKMTAKTFNWIIAGFKE